MRLPAPISRRLLTPILRVFFKLLYHEFAWSYDIVAFCVSLGRWNDWGKVVIPYIDGQEILELGHGPGHLQEHLWNSGCKPVGVDRSFQMNTLAAHRIQKHAQSAIIRSTAQQLPFISGYFSTVISTFPSEYIYDPESLAEIKRTLNRKGRLVIVPAAWLTSGDLLTRMAAALFRITGQVPAESPETASHLFAQPFKDAGFTCTAKIVEVRGSQVLVIIATAP